LSLNKTTALNFRNSKPVPACFQHKLIFLWLNSKHALGRHTFATQPTFFKEWSRMISLRELAVIIPVAPGDSVGSFSGRSQKTAIESEILFVSQNCPQKALKHWFQPSVMVPSTSSGTPAQCRCQSDIQTLSLALHADSRFTESTLDKLEKLQHKPDALHYFDLVFLDDGPALTAITVGSGSGLTYWLCRSETVLPSS